MMANSQKSTSKFLSPILSSNFHFWGGGGDVGDGQFSKVNFEFSKSSPQLKFPFLQGEGGLGDSQFSKVNFKLSNSNSELKFPLSEFLS